MELFRTRERCYSDADLAAALAPLGLEGRNLLVYSRLLSFGRFGGADTLVRLLEVLRQALGPDGTLCVAAYSFSAYNHEVFDSANSKCIVGALGEVARTMPGFIRTEHPVYSTACAGPAAAALAAGQRPETCFGDGSFFDLFARLPNAGVLLLGANLCVSTIQHYYDQKHHAPGRFVKATFSGQMLRDGEPQAITFDSCVKDYDYYADKVNCPARFDTLLTELGIVRRSPFAGDWISLVDEKDFQDAYALCLRLDQPYFMCSDKETWERYYLKNDTSLFRGKLDPEKVAAFQRGFGDR